MKSTLAGADGNQSDQHSLNHNVMHLQDAWLKSLNFFDQLLKTKISLFIVYVYVVFPVSELIFVAVQTIMYRSYGPKILADTYGRVK